MKYIRVHWLHEVGEEEEPVWIFSELDDESWETRKVHVFSNGTSEAADAISEMPNTRLGIEPHPSCEEIAKDPHFVPEIINKEEFEAVWARATKSNSL